MKNKKPKIKKPEFSFGGQLKAGLPGALTALGGIATEIAAPGNPVGIGMIASGVGNAYSGVNKYNSQEELLKQQQIDSYNQQYNQPPPMYKHGGMKHHLHPHFTSPELPSGMYGPQFEMGGTAELEKQEVFKTPNGDIDAVNGASHENGGVPINIPNGTKILSDKLKMDGKTFADLGSKYKTTKEDKILADNLATPASQASAKLAAQVKQKKLDQLFQAQESLKQSKLASYAAKLGVQLPQVNRDNELTEQDSPQQEQQEGEFAYGGINGLPEYAYSTPLNEGEYKHGGIYIKPSHRGRFTAYKERTGKTTQEALHSSDPHVRKMAVFANNAKHFKHEMGGIHKYEDGGLSDIPYENTGFNANPYLDNFVNQQTTADQDFNNINNYNFDKSMIDLENAPIKQTIPSTSKSIPYGDIAAGVAGSAGAIYGLATNKKLPPVNYNLPSVKYLDPSVELASNAGINSNNRNMLKDNVGGNAGAYLANIGQIGAQNAARNAATITKYNNINTGIYNQNQVDITGIKNKGIDETRADQAQTRNLNTAYVGQIGRQATQSYLDYKRGKMDQNSAKLISSAFANYGLDITNPDDWKVYFKQTGGKI